MEFVIGAGILFLLLFGVIDFAYAWNQREDLTHSVQEVARQAAVGENAESILQDRFGDALIDMDVQCGTLDPQTPSSAYAKIRLDSVTGLFRPFIGSDLESTVEVRTERENLDDSC